MNIYQEISEDSRACMGWELYFLLSISLGLLIPVCGCADCAFYVVIFKGIRAFIFIIMPAWTCAPMCDLVDFGSR
jgi:hypothetical protein